MSRTGFRYFVTFFYDYSRTTWLYLMKNRSELFSHFYAFYAKIHTQFHVSIQSLISDKAKEYVSKQFNHSCFKMVSSKRKNGHLLEISKTLLFQMHVPKHFWADVVSTACFLIDRMSSSVLNWDTPYHILFPNKPLFPNEPRIFRCTCFVGDVRSHISKLDPKSLKCIFLGYSRV